MKMMNVFGLCIGLFLSQGFAGPQPLTVAVFNFETGTENAPDLGQKVSSIVSAELSASADFFLVERAELEKALGEQELGLSGTIRPEEAARIGQLTGAKVLVTGRVFKVDAETIAVAKVISSETSRVYGAMVKGNASTSISTLAEQLSKKISDVITQKGEVLVAKENNDDRLAELKKRINLNNVFPVRVKITEKHFGGPTHDPAAETELAFILQKCGFSLLSDASKDLPKVELIGEAFSEFGLRKGNLVSCKARVEIKAIDKATGKVLMVDRQTNVAIDLSEQIAAKTALQKAAFELALRLVPELTK
jgi:hypothetical protein